MNDHPLGNIAPADTYVPEATSAKSIVDTVLNLDELLAADIRLAEKTYRFSINPALEARMEDLSAELGNLVDAQGRPKATIDASMADGARSAHAVALELEDLEVEYAASMRTGRVRQMDEDDWTAFQTKWKTALNDLPPYPVEFWEQLIVKCATQPTFTAEQLRQLRKKVGHPAFTAIADSAWAANTQSGVSVPKSSLSSAVLRHIAQG